MRSIYSLFATIALLSTLGIAGCGSSNSGDPKTEPECTANGLTCTLSADCCTGNCDEALGVCTRVPGVCTAAGGDCQLGPDCCSFSCVGFTCSTEQCISDNEACDEDGQCCGGVCTGGTCAPLNPSCATSGNECTDNGDCCSKYCKDNVCSAAPSYCTQAGDICSNDLECCGGFCSIGEGATAGTCQLAPASGAGSCLSAGEVCGGVYDGSPLPICGGECCSRACLPYGETGVLICQPPSGCRPTGETCQNDTDCCGGPGNPDNETANVTCSKVGDNPVGRCDAGNSCTPAGGICRLQTNSCNENANCCSGNVLQNDTCKLDSLGIPRCLAAEIDCTDPTAFEGMDCATSADCCGLPCTPMGSGEFPPLKCGGEVCVYGGGSCTTSADCCSSLPCVLEPGSNQGTCGSTPGSCAEYGQACEMNADCCNQLGCIDGTCTAVIQ